jgi:CBS domain containing-hemolysin-like protein
LAEVDRVPRAASLLRHVERPDQMITMLLIGTNLMVVTCTIIVAFGVTYLERFLPRHVTAVIEDLVSVAIVAPIMLVFAEIIPKSIFRTHPTRLALACYPVIQFFYAVLAPIAAPVAWITRGVLTLLGGRDRPLSPLMSSLEDVRDLVDEGVDHGTIEPEEQEMIHSVIDLQATTAKEIMVPRIAIEALPDTATRDELVTVLAATGRTRIPIYHEKVDQIIGVVSAYAILRDPEPERQDIDRFVKPVRHVPDTIKVDDLLRELRAAKQHLAIVTDEYGGTDGLVTIEDILEEIFGEIQDEHDHEESPIHKLGPNAYVVDARTALEQISEAIGVTVVDEEVETVGGWLMHVAGHIPAQGEVIEHGRFRMTVLAGLPNQVSRIRLEVLPEPPPAPNDRTAQGRRNPPPKRA